MQHWDNSVRLARVYELSDSDDGFRVLVDCLWPRGIKKESLRLDRWAKDLAPTSSLRQWFNHDSRKWEVFRKRYKDELINKHALLLSLLKDAEGHDILFIYAAKDRLHNHAIVLQDYFEETFL